MRKALAFILIPFVLTIACINDAFSANKPLFSISAFVKYCTNWNDYFAKSNPYLYGSYYLSDDEMDIGTYFITYNEDHFRMNYSCDVLPATASIMIMFFPELASYSILIMDDNLNSHLTHMVVYGKNNEPIALDVSYNEELENTWAINIQPSDVFDLYYLESIQAELIIDGKPFEIEINKKQAPFLYRMFDWHFGAFLYASIGSESFLDEGLLPDKIYTANTSNDHYSFKDDVDGINKAAKSVFYVETYDDKLNLLGTASGFIAFDEHLFVTNQHVISDASYLMIYDDDGNKYVIDEVVASDSNKDIALLLFSQGNLYDALELNKEDDIKRGQSVVAIGSPHGLQNTVSKGDVSAIRLEGSMKYLQISASISHGSSGGALFDNNGYVIGITTSGLVDGQNLNFAVPIQFVIDLYKQWNKSSYEFLGSEKSWDMAAYALPASHSQTNSKAERAGSDFKLYSDENSGISFMYPANWEEETNNEDTNGLIIVSKEALLSMIEYSNIDMWPGLTDYPDIVNNSTLETRNDLDSLLMDKETASICVEHYEISELEKTTYGNLNVYTGYGEFTDDHESNLIAHTMVVYFANNGYVHTFFFASVDAFNKDLPIFEDIIRSIELS